MTPPLKPLAVAVCLLPLALLGWKAATGGLGANPIEATTRHLGWWALCLILLTLAVTPLRQLTGWNRLVRVRRLVGLFAFGYAALHWSSYLGLDQFFDWGEIWKDLVKRPYITIGMLTFLLLVPLAVTSTDAWVRRLGGKRWQRLHYLVYPVAALGVLHYFLLVKADLRGPSLFAVVLSALLGYRVYRRRARAVAGMPGAGARAGRGTTAPRAPEPVEAGGASGPSDRRPRLGRAGATDP